jgi:NCAIR mutase (PurE)-related protein
MKKHHFEIEDKITATKKDSLEWMRINTERERISRFKQIVCDSAATYYSIVERYSKLLEERKQALQSRGSTVEQDMPSIMKQTRIETQLFKTL